MRDVLIHGSQSQVRPFQSVLRAWYSMRGSDRKWRA